MDPSSQQLKNERSKYYVFREKTNTLAKRMLESYNKYYNVQKLINEAYQVDGSGADKGVLAKEMQKLKDAYNLLINSTVPSITRKIDNLTYQIRQVEQREETEEERRLAEAKAKADASYYERI